MSIVHSYYVLYNVYSEQLDGEGEFKCVAGGVLVSSVMRIA